MKMKCKIERENKTTSYFPDVLNKLGKHDLTIGIYQEPNEADIIIYSTPIIERNIRVHKKAAGQTAYIKYQYLRKKQKTTALLGISHVKRKVLQSET